MSGAEAERGGSVFGALAEKTSYSFSACVETFLTHTRKEFIIIFSYYIYVSCCVSCSVSWFVSLAVSFSPHKEMKISKVRVSLAVSLAVSLVVSLVVS